MFIIAIYDRFNNDQHLASFDNTNIKQCVIHCLQNIFPTSDDSEENLFLNNLLKKLPDDIEGMKKLLGKKGLHLGVLNLAIGL